MQTLIQRFTSRKFLVSVLGGLFIALSDEIGLGLDPEQVYGLVGVIAAFVAGEAVIDKQRVSALVDSQVEAFKLQANSYVASLVKELEALKAQPEGGE
jgi:uncharacterized membrane protein